MGNDDQLTKKLRDAMGISLVIPWGCRSKHVLYIYMYVYIYVYVYMCIYIIYIYICTGIDRYTVYILYLDMGSSETGPPNDVSLRLNMMMT